MVTAKILDKAGPLFDGLSAHFTPTTLELTPDPTINFQKLKGKVDKKLFKKTKYVFTSSNTPIGDELDYLKNLSLGPKCLIVCFKYIDQCAREKKFAETFWFVADLTSDTKIDTKADNGKGNKRVGDQNDGNIAKGVKLDDDDDKKDDKANVKKDNKINDEVAKKAVDIKVPNGGSYKVYYDQDCFYDAMMNQTNIGANNNKFYILQLLVDNAGNFIVWARWGRVGVDGQSSWDDFGTNLDSALTKFKSKFYSKCGHIWGSSSYPHISKKYLVMERDYNDDEEDNGDTKTIKDESGNMVAIEDIKIPDSELSEELYNLVEWMFDFKMMSDAMSHLDYDTKKMPLGKLTKDHIKSSMIVLDELSDELTRPSPSRSVLIELSSKFYTIIPHAFGMRAPPVIDCQDGLKKKLEMIESLAEIQVATAILNKFKPTTAPTVNPVDQKYLALNNRLTHLPKDSEQFKMIENYTTATHGETHSWYNLDVMEAFEVDRLGEHDKFNPFENDPNRMLLWHGSRLTNYVGILSQGLRIAPPEAPVTGYMFGKGVYFADIVSKSANYTHAHATGNTALMLLCEIALGPMLQLKNSDYYANKTSKDNNKLSTKGLGRSVPDPKQFITLDNGCVVPMGKPINLEGDDAHGLCLQYNEYIVYNTDQIKMKYLIKVKYNNTY